MQSPEGLQDTPLMLLSNIKFLVEIFFKFCGLLKIFKPYHQSLFLAFLTVFLKVFGSFCEDPLKSLHQSAKVKNKEYI